MLAPFFIYRYRVFYPDASQEPCERSYFNYDMLFLDSIILFIYAQSSLCVKIVPDLFPEKYLLSLNQGDKVRREGNEPKVIPVLSIVNTRESLVKEGFVGLVTCRHIQI